MVFTSYLRPSQAPSVAPSVAPSRGRTSPMRSPTPIRGSVPPTERGHRDNLTNGAMLSGTPASRTRRDTSNHRGLSAGIDLALLALSEEVRCSARFYRDFYQDFEQQTAGLKEWVEDSTLDILWKDRVKYKFHARGESERLRSMVDRVRRCQEAVKDAIESTGGGRSSATDAKYQMEHQVHTAKKALVYCEVLAELIERAAEERIACKYLVSELEEARNLLNRKRHPWIYGRDACEIRIPKVRGASKGKHKSESKPLPETPSGSEITSTCGRKEPEKLGGKVHLSEKDVESAQDKLDDIWS